VFQRGFAAGRKAFRPRGFFAAAGEIAAESLQFSGDAAIAVPMDKDSVIRTLRAHEAELRAEGISHVYLFGSVARGEADEKSDVDIFFDYDDPTFSLFDLMQVKRHFGDILRTRVDAMTRRSVHPCIRNEVEAEAVQVF
jgi:predicted nucleotidyltransferase